jgi:hypothetical protein
LIGGKHYMNRRKALLGLSAGTVAATGVTFAQQGTSGGPVGTNLRALILSGGAVVGSFDIKRFAAIAGQVQAIGTATLTDGTRTVVTTLALPVTLTTSAASDPAVTCPILHLAIGAINLNLLGLVITISPITIDIVAVPGPGNLLGNLLCAIANLLNSGTLATILNQLIALLNQLLASL